MRHFDNGVRIGQHSTYELDQFPWIIHISFGSMTVSSENP